MSRVCFPSQLTGFAGILPIVASLGLAGPIAALEVRVSPSAPALGDTLTVIITRDPDTTLDPNSAPTVQVNGHDYASFPVGLQRFRTLLPTTPLETPGNRTLSVTDINDEQQVVTVNVRDRDFPIQNIWLSPEVNAIEGTDYEFDQMDAFRARVTPERLWTGAFIDPADAPRSTPYGVRRYYNGEWAEDYYHRGVDFAAAEGSPVYAAADGIVGLVGREADGFEVHGNAIGINHGQGVTTTYLHLSRIDVEVGDRVQAGDVIGAVGATGISTGPHLHWGLFVQGEAVDPAVWQSQGIK